MGDERVKHKSLLAQQNVLLKEKGILLIILHTLVTVIVCVCVH